MMFKSVQDFENVMAIIVTNIYEEEDITKSLKIHDIDILDALQECIDRGLIKGVNARVNAQGKLFLPDDENPRLTYYGLVLYERNKSNHLWVFD